MEEPLVRHASIVSADKAMLNAQSATARRFAWLWEGVAQYASCIVAARGSCDAPSGGVAIGERARAFGACARTPWGLRAAVRRALASRADVPAPSVVIAQDPLWRAYAARAVLEGVQPTPAFAVEAHADYGSPHYPWSGFVGRWLFKRAQEAFARASVVRAVSERVRRGLVTRFGIAESATFSLPVWMDLTALLRRVGADTPSLHATLPQCNFIVAWVGRMEREKGGSVALEAFRHLLEKDPHACLVMVGDGSERPALEAKARRLGVGERVVFPGWQEDAFAWIAGADAFLLTSSHEGFGRVLVEAAIAKKPIVSTDVGIVGEILRPNEEALVALPGDAVALGKHLSTLLSDHATRRLLGMSAHDRVREVLAPLFEPTAYQQRFRAYIERALFGAPQRSAG
ncbi:MAG: hypothetical protein KatS3mg100_116 [Candidatus Parcubacteria bacterium]|nr:MAG: hypothetical protein KatS3mg100_116 [Candidatus Parcubacteria bacterium]